MKDNHKYLKRFLAFVLSAAMIVTYMPVNLIAYAQVAEPAAAEEVLENDDTQQTDTEAASDIEDNQGNQENQSGDASDEPAAPAEADSQEKPAGTPSADTQSDQTDEPSGEEGTPSDDPSNQEEGQSPGTEVTYPAQTFESDSVGGVDIKVAAPDGALPKGTEMVVKEADQAAIEGDEVLAVNIAFEKDGKEVKPLEDVVITMKAANPTDGLEYQVYNGTEKVADAGKEFETKDFEVFAVVGVAQNAITKAPTRGTDEEWTVTFYNRDGEVHTTVNVPKGQPIGDLMPDTIKREDYIAYWAVGTIDEHGTTTVTERITSDYVPEEDTTVVPDYEQINYTITFYENQDDTDPIATKTVNSGTSYCLNDIPEVPVKDGYAGRWVYSGGDFTNQVAVTEDTRVWAAFDQNVFTVTFKVDGDEYKTDTYYEGDTLELPAEPVVEGKQFTGWFVGETEYEGGEEVTSDLELTAAFEDEYKVDFVILNDDGTTSERLSQYFRTEGEPIGTLPQNPFVSGKIFEKWVIQGTDTEVTAETVVEGNMTVQAVFRSVEVYDITAEYYYLNDRGEEVIFNTDFMQVESHELPYTITAPSSTQTSSDEVAGAPIYYPETPTVTVEAADFDAENKHTVRFKYVPYTAEYDFVYMLKDLEGDGYTEIPDSREHVYGVLNSYVTPTVKNFDYAVLELAEGTTIDQASGQELVVKYKRKNFSLSYETNGGSYVQGGTYAYGSTVSLPTTDPTREGYNFEGWYSDEALTNRVTGNVTINGDTTLYAKWTGKTIGYTIIYMKEVYDNATNTTSYVYENSRNATGTVGSTVYAANAQNISSGLNGYTRDAAMNGTATAGGTGEDTAVEIKADGSTVLKVYYSLIRYTLVFNINYDDGRIYKNGREYSGSNYKIENVVLGQDVSEKWPAGSDEVYDSNTSWYHTEQYFDYWTGGAGNYVTTRYELIWDDVSKANTTTNVVTYTGHWTYSNASRYAVYWLQQPDGTYKEYKDYTQYAINTTNLGAKNISGYSKHNGTPNGYPGSGNTRYVPDTNGSYIRRNGNWQNVGANAYTDYQHYRYANSNSYVYDFYYDRAKYDIIYHFNGSVIRTIADIYFEADISGNTYNYTPNKPANTSTIDYSDYTWGGWYADSALTTPYTFSTMPGNDLMLYAKWVAPTFTVNFEMDGGTPAEDSQTVSKYERAKKPETNPTKSGYTFEGWFTSADGEELYDWNNQITKNTTIYAHWSRKSPTYTVKYVDEDGNDVAPAKEVSNPNFVVGQTVTEQAIAVAGYRPDRSSDTLTLGDDDSANVIKFVYKQKTETTSYKVRYLLDPEEYPGDIAVAQEKVVNDIPGDTSSVIELAAAVDYDALYAAHSELTGVEFFPDEVEKTLVLSSEADQNVLTFYYSSYKNAKVTVNYVDMDGNTIADSDTQVLKVGKTFTLSRTPIAGWALDKAVEGTDYDGSEAGSSYKITQAVAEHGTLVFTLFYKKTVTITAKSLSKQYDGTDLKLPGDISGQITVTGLPEGESITGIGFSYSGTDNDAHDGRLNAGTATVTPKDAVTNGTHAQNYYAFRYISGSLTVTKINVTVRVEPDRWVGLVYDGTERKAGFTNSSKTSVEDYVMISHEGYKTAYLNTIWNTIIGLDSVKEGGDGLGYYVESQKDAGDYSYDLGLTEAMIPNGNDNYSVSLFVRSGRLQIQPKPVTLTSETASKPYDGTPLTKPDVTGGDQFVAGEVSEVKATGSVTYVEEGEIDNTITYTPGELFNENNYTITKNEGKLSITPSTTKILVTSKDGTWTYDGNAHTKHEYTVTYGDATATPDPEDESGLVFILPTKDKVTITPAETATVTHVDDGEVTNAFTYTVEHSDQYSDKDKTEGKLKVTPATLTITTSSATKAYDGSALTAPGNISGFVTPTGGEEETATFTVTGSQTKVGKSDNTYTLTWDGTATESDYVLSENIGKLEVTKNTTELIVQSLGATWTYDGNAHTKHEYIVTYGNDSHSVTIADGETTGTITLSTGDVVTITPDESATITHVAESDVDNAFSYTVDNSDQYDNQKKVEGALTVTPATLTITTNSASREYNGQPLTAEGSISGFVNNETATFTVTGSQTEVGKSDNTYTLTWEGTATESDYKLSETIGKLEVTASTKELKVVSDNGEWTYDGGSHTKHKYTVTYGDETLAGTEGQTVFNLSTGDTVTVSPASAAKITHVAEGNVTNAFSYTVTHSDFYANQAKEEGTLKVNPATLTVVTNSASKEYDGKPLTARPGSITGFVTPPGAILSEDATFTVTGSQTDVGSSQNTYRIDWFGSARETDYTVVADLGTLTVTKSTKELKVESADGEWTYDASAHTKKVYTVTYGDETIEGTEGQTEFTLSTGDKLTVTPAETATVTHVADGEVANAFTWNVENDTFYTKGDDTTGTLTIKPATLTIVTESASKEYDGTELTADGSISGFVNNETAAFTVTGSQTEVGSSTNTYSLVWDGTAVSTDYKPSEDLGTLTVKKSTKELKVESADGEWTYDGNAHTMRKYTVTYGTQKIEGTEGQTVFELSTGDKVSITPAAAATITHAAESPVNNAFTWTVENDTFYTKGDDTVGTLTVTPATLTITTESAEKEYDGKPLTANGNISGFVTPTGGTQETATFTVTGSQTNVGESNNTYTIEWDGTARQTDYTISPTLGKLKVTASTKELKIESADGSWTYDGNAHVKHEYTVTYGEETATADASGLVFTLSTGDKVTITPDTAATITHVAENDVTNAFSYTVGNSDQYAKQEKVEGKLTIKPATLTITTESAEKEYDGEPLTANGNISGFVTPTGGTQETATFTVTGSQTEVGESDNTYTLTFNGTAVESDYELDKTIGKLVVTKSTKELKVESKDGSWTYDGNAHTKQQYTVTYGDETIEGTEGQTEFTLSTGDKLTVTPAEAATITHVAQTTVDNAFTWTVENEDFYTKGTDKVGKLSVTPAALTIKTESADKEYDGKPLTAGGTATFGETETTLTAGEAVTVALAGSESISVKITGTQTPVGSSKNKYEITWGDVAETDYSVTDTVGDLVVNKNTKSLRVTSSDGEWTYDGNAHVKHEYTVKYGNEEATPDESGLVFTLSTGDKVTIVPSDSATITHVAESPVDNSFTWTVENEDYYTKADDTVGKLTIKPATLTIVTESADKEYDGEALIAEGSISGFVTPTGGTQETATFEVTGSQTEVGKSNNTYTLTWDGTAVETDYEIDDTIGELEVKKSTAELKVASKDGTWTYDGNAHTKYEYTVTFGDKSYEVTIAEGDASGTVTLSTGDVLTITPAAAAKITHVAETTVDNAFTWTVENEDFYTKGTDKVGKLSVTPAKLTIVTESAEKEYDGEPLTAEGSISGFVTPTGGEEETATFKVTGAQTVVGKSNNTYSLTWDGTAVESDYELDETIGELEVKKSTTELKVESKDGSWTYDGNAHTKQQYTVTYGDETIEGTEGQTEFTLSTGDKLTVTPAEAATITHVAQTTVDNAFTWTVANESYYTKGEDTVGKLSVTPATLTIKTESAEKEYDGKPLTTGGSISGFVTPTGGAEETATFEVIGSQTEVGKSDNTYSLTWDGTATQSDYTLAETIGELEVKKSTTELIVESKDGSWTYDSTSHTKYEYTVKYGDESYDVTITGSASTGTATLSTGDKVTITPASTAKITHVSETTVDNAFTWTVENETFYTKGEDKVGKLSITPAPLTITADSNSKEYDGTPLTDDGWKDTAPVGLQGSDAVESVTVTGSQTAVGKSDNVASDAVIKNGDTDVTSDYKVTYVKGELEVTASTAELKVESKDGTWTYDGDAHTKYEYTVTYGDKTYNVTIAEGETSGTATLSTGDVLTITPAATAKITHVAETTVNNAFTWTVENETFYTKGDDKVGKLSVTPAKLTIVTESANKEYDGKALTAPGTINGFAKEETATFTVTGSQTEVGKSDNTYTLTWDGTAVETDYEIDDTIGELEVKKSTAELKVASKDGTWTYDGNAHTKYEYTVTFGDKSYEVTIAEGDASGTVTLSTGDVLTITPAAAAKITHVAETTVDNAFTWKVENDSFYTKGEDTVGKLSVTPATLTITTSSATKAYDGKALTAPGSISGFVTPTGGAEETATFTVTGSQTKIGKSDNTYTLTWDGTATESDYVLSEDIGELEVTKNTTELIVQSQNGNWTYDGKAHTKFEYTVTYGSENYTVTIEGDAENGTATLSTGDVVTITPDESATITHVAESDVDNAFSYTVDNSDQYDNQKKVEGALTVTPATLTITTNSASREYNGQPLTSDGSISGFVNNETATFTVTGSQTEVGKSDNTYSLTWDGTATQSDYTLAETIGELEVKKNTTELKVESKDGEWTYDGDAHTKYEYTVTFGTESYNVTIEEGETTGTATLATGDVVTITPADTATITHVAETTADNAFTWTVANEGFYTKGEDTVGTLSVTPAKLTIVTESASKEYDGTELTADGSISGFVKNETATFEVTGTQTAVGKSDNTYSLVWDGTAAASDYELDETIGELEVTKSTKVLKVESKNGSWTYDGDAHTKQQYIVTYGDETIEGTEGQTEFTLSTGDKLTVTPAASAKITHVAETTVDNAFTWTVENAAFYTKGEDKVGTLSVTPATLTVVTESATKEYDGKSLTAPGTIEGFVKEESALFVVTGTQTKVGKSNNTYEIVWIETAKETDYVIDETVGELEVTKSTKELKVESKDGEWTYDGNEHTKYEYTVTYGDESYDVTITGSATTGTATLSTGDKVTITAAASAKITHVAETTVDNAFTWTIENGSFYTKGEDTVGTLSITPAKLTIVTESASKEYDGTELTADGSISGFVKNETATFKVTGTQTLAGKSDNTYSLVWDGTATKTDYELDETIGELEVTKSTKELKVESKDGEWTYDGSEHTKYEYTVTYGNESYEVKIAGSATTGTATLSTGDVVTITPAATAKITYVAENDVTNAFSYTLGNSDQYSSQSKEEGKLTINAASLTITAASDNKVYDATPLTKDSYTNTDLAAGDTIDSVTVTGSQTAVGSSDNVPSEAKIVNGSGEDVTSSYDITYVNGTLTVTPATLTITVKDQEYTYNGSAQGEDNNTYTDDSKVTVEGLKGSDALTSIKLDGNETDAGVYENKIVASDAEIGQATGNYEITYVAGKLTIKKAPAEQLGLEVTGHEGKYDGQEHAVSATTTVTEGTTIEYSTDGGKTWSEEAPKIKDAGSKDVQVRATNKNYETATGSAKLKVDPREVQMTSATAEQFYNGIALVAQIVTESLDGFVSGEGATYDVTGQQVTPGTSDNTFEYELTEATKAANYIITTVLGTLTVKDRTDPDPDDPKPEQDKYQVELNGNDGEFTYDGTEHTVTGFKEEVDGTLTYTNDDGVTFTIEGLKAAGSGINAGTYDVEITGTEQIKDPTTGTDVTDQFKITKNSGKLVIKPASIEPEDPDDPINSRFELTDPEDVKYNGKSQQQDVTIVDSKTGKTLVKDVDYTLEYSEDTTNAGAVIVTVTGKGNYEGTIKTDYEILKRDIILESASDEKVYDGTPLTNDTITVGGDGLAETDVDKISFDVTGSQTYVGSSDNTFDYAWADGSKAEETTTGFVNTFRSYFTAYAERGDLADNYNVEKKYGTLTVTDKGVDNDKVVRKSHEDEEYEAGDTVTFDVEATNIYDENKTITLVEKDGVKLAQSVFEDVAPGETVTTTATYKLTEKDAKAGTFQNIIKAKFSGEGTEFWNKDDVDVEGGEGGSNGGRPKTGDTGFGADLMIFFGSAAGLFALLFRRRRREQE